MLNKSKIMFMGTWVYYNVYRNVVLASGLYFFIYNLFFILKSVWIQIFNLFDASTFKYVKIFNLYFWIHIFLFADSLPLPKWDCMKVGIIKLELYIYGITKNFTWDQFRILLLLMILSCDKLIEPNSEYT